MAEKLTFNMKDPMNVTLGLDLIIFMFTALNSDAVDLQPEKRMEMVNEILESWEKRLIHHQVQMNKVNSHALAEGHDDMTEDVANILMDIHAIETNTVRKEFKRLVRHLAREAIENKK